MFSHDNYKPSLQQTASRLRKEMTKAEACLWKYILRARQVGGFQFRRQRPLLNYVVDFVCLEKKLVIEVDGLTHHDDEVIKKDRVRDEVLTTHGFTVLRFTDAEVLGKIQFVREVIWEWIQSN